MVPWSPGPLWKPNPMFRQITEFSIFFEKINFLCFWGPKKLSEALKSMFGLRNFIFLGVILLKLFDLSYDRSWWLIGNIDIMADGHGSWRAWWLIGRGRGLHSGWLAWWLRGMMTWQVSMMADNYDSERLRGGEGIVSWWQIGIMADRLRFAS